MCPLATGICTSGQDVHQRSRQLQRQSWAHYLDVSINHILVCPSYAKFALFKSCTDARCTVQPDSRQDIGELHFRYP